MSINKENAQQIIDSSTNLDELLYNISAVYVAAKKLRDSGDEHANADEWVDFSELPTFGGDGMYGEGIWSWDEERLLVGQCVDEFEIVDRSEVTWAD